MGELLNSPLTVRRIGRCGRLVLGTPEIFKRRGTPAAPADLSGHQAVVYLQGEGSIWSFSRDGSEASVKVSSSAEGDGGRGRTRGGPFARWPRYRVRMDVSPELRCGAVCRVLSEWSVPPMDLWAVFPTGRSATAKARASWTSSSEISIHDRCSQVSLSGEHDPARSRLVDRRTRQPNRLHLADGDHRRQVAAASKGAAHPFLCGIMPSRT